MKLDLFGVGQSSVPRAVLLQAIFTTAISYCFPLQVN